MAKKKIDDTHITLVMDRSGSMRDIARDMEGGVNEFLKAQLALPGKCFVSLVLFDDKIEVVHDGVPIKDVPELKIEPRGPTALNDAIMRGIDLAAKSKAPKQVFVIVTDGEENMSREHSAAHVKTAIEKHSSCATPWAFMFFGASKDAIGQAGVYGIAASNAMGYQASAGGVRGMSVNMTNASSAYRGGSRSANDLGVASGKTDPNAH